MKLIKAIIKPEKLPDVKAELAKEKILGMTVYDVHGCGQQKGYSESYRGNIVEVNLLNKVRFEIAVNDEFVKQTIDSIIEAAKTNNIGDGKIFVMPIDQCYRIRTSEEGNNAIG